MALETSTTRPSLAVRAGGRTREAVLAGERPHASDLLPTLERLLAELGVRPREVEAVLVGTGPGSYTGLRVGVATALGLARGSGAALFGLSSLEALAWSELAPGEGGAFLLDARQDQLYVARYAREEQAMAVRLAPRIATAAQLGELLDPQERIFADAPALRAAGLGAELARPSRRCVVDAYPRAAAVLELGLERLAREGAHAPEDVEPLYLRAFAARTRRR